MFDLWSSFFLQNNTIRKSCQLVNNALVTFDLLLRHCPVRTPAGSFNFTTLRYLSSSSHPSDAMSTSSGSGSSKTKSKSMTNVFTPKKALVLGKFSRYEFEKHRNPNLSEEEFIQSVSLDCLTTHVGSLPIQFSSSWNVEVLTIKVYCTITIFTSRVGITLQTA